MTRATILTAMLCVSAATAVAGETTLRMRVTAYCPCKVCCGPDAKGINRDGSRAQPGRIAADWDVLPKGSRVVVPGYGNCVVADTGSKIVGHRLDVFFWRHEDARRWGVRYLTVKVTQ